MTSETNTDTLPDNPVLVKVRRGAAVESVHRGAWVLVDSSGEVLEGEGNWSFPYYARSSIKCVQALPLLETGAAERYGFGEEELALALSSHNGEACHTERVRATLERLGLKESNLACGAQVPADPTVRRELDRSGAKPSQLHNNCSGKHAGFLALSRQLDVPPERYLDPTSDGQVLVREAVAEMCDVDASSLVPALDGCSAPTYRIPLHKLALAFARVTNPDGLAAERRAHAVRMTEAIAKHPVLLAGSHKRLDTDLVRASGGRLFPKIGAEAVYIVGVRGADRAFALKIDDGAYRGLNVLVCDLLQRLGLASESELSQLETWSAGVRTNRAGLDAGSIEVVR